jgi:5-methylcytosine-specific restriction endonuclease McrA
MIIINSNPLYPTIQNRKTMKVKDRQFIFDKYGGRCAYCGCELNKGWHVDHIEPVDRCLLTNQMTKPERDVIENMMPSCPSCNNYKHSFPLETFRSEVGLLVGRLNSTFNQYKIAKRFGLIQETGTEVKFYFETYPINEKP